MDLGPRSDFPPVLSGVEILEVSIFMFRSVAIIKMVPKKISDTRNCDSGSRKIFKLEGIMLCLNRESQNLNPLRR